MASLPDAELRKNRIEDLFVHDFAGDLSDVVEGGAKLDSINCSKNVSGAGLF
jgi:hypothetical protein